MDVSSHQPIDLGELIARNTPEHVVVKLYLESEAPSKAISLAQIASAQANGCSVSGYVWCYREVSPEDTVSEAVELLQQAGIRPPVRWIDGIRIPALWLDVEPYKTDDNIPDAAWVMRACAQAYLLNVEVGIYTGAWCWPRVGAGNKFADIPLWAAQPDHIADPDVFTPFGGWTRCAGKQYSADGIDLDVFRKTDV